VGAGAERAAPFEAEDARGVDGEELDEAFERDEAPVDEAFEGEADGITTDQVVAGLIEAVPMRPDAVEKAMTR